MATTWKVKSCWNHLVYLKGISGRKSMVNFAAKVWLQVHFWLVVPALFHHFIPPQLSQFTHLLLEFHSSLGDKVMDSSLGTSVGMLKALVNGYRLFSTSISTVESHLSDLGGKPGRWKKCTQIQYSQQNIEFHFVVYMSNLMWIACPP